MPGLLSRWRFFVSLLLLMSLFGAIGAGAQSDESTATPEVTEAAAPAIIEETQVVEVTAEPTVEVTAEPTIEVTPEPTPEATSEATSDVEPTLDPTIEITEVPLTPEQPLSVLVIDSFDTLDNWLLGAGWTLDASGTFLQATNSAEAIQLLRGVFFNAAAQARFRLNAGAVSLSMRVSAPLAYSAVLDVSGQVSLLRAGETKASASVKPLAADTWRDLRISANGSTVRVYVDGIEVIAWADEAPLPPGGVSIAAVFPPQPTDGTTRTDVLDVEDFVLWVPTTELMMYPTVTPTLQPTVEVPVEPTIEITPEVTLEPTVEATVEVTPEATVEATAEVTEDSSTVKAAGAFPLPLDPSAAPPPNDAFMGAVAINTVPFAISGTTSEATLEGSEPTPGCTFAITGSVWYRFTAPEAAKYTFSTAGTGFDTVLALYSGASLNALTQLACNDDVSGSLQAVIKDYSLTQNQIVYVQLSGYNGNRGSFEFSIQQTGVAIPRPPVLSSPNNGALINEADLPLAEVAWNAPTSGPIPDSYEIQIDNNNNFSSPEITDVVTIRTYDVSSLTDGRWFWRVRSLNINGQASAWARARNFTIDTQEPDSPTLRTPLDDSTVSSPRPTLSWIRTTGATGYRVELAEDAAFTSVLLDDYTLAGTSLPLNPRALLAPLGQGDYFWRVQARDAAGNWSDESDVWSFTVNLARTPAHNSIVNSAVLPSLPTFQWTAAGVTGAQYYIEIADDSDFGVGDILFTSPTISTISYKLGDGSVLPAYGTYYWRVIVNADVPDPLLNIYNSFIVSPGTVKAVKLNTPANNAATSDNTPDFVWTPFPAGTTGEPFTYEIQVATDSRYSDVVFSASALTDGTITPGSPLPDGRLYWRVRALNNVSAPGPWASRSLTVDTLAQQLRPADGSFTIDTTPTFSWNGVPGATTYFLVLEGDTVGALPVYETNRLTFTTPVLQPDVYTWRVDYTLDGVTTITSSVEWVLTVTQRPLAAPQITFPTNNLSVSNANLEVIWNVVTNPDDNPLDPSDNVEYQVQIDNDARFRTPEYDTTTEDLQVVPTALEDTNSRWNLRIRTINHLGVPGPWSPVRRFVTDNLPPAAPVFTAPRNGATITDDTPTIVWRAVPGASRYDLRYNSTLPLSDADIKVDDTAARNHTTPALSKTTQYFQVRAIDAAGNVGPWSSVLSIKIASAPNAAPVPNRFDTDTPTLTWTPISWAVGYELQIATNATFTSLVAGAGSDAIAAGTLAHTSGVSLSDGIYYWRVRAKITSSPDTWGGWSGVGTFLVQN